MTEVLPTEKNVAQAQTSALLNKINGGLEQIRNVTNITAQRHAFSDVTKTIFAFLEAARYDNGQVYLQECPMAFNDNDSGFWLSRMSGIRNPYLGLHHPTYGKGMVGCGDTSDSIYTQPAK